MPGIWGGVGGDQLWSKVGLGNSQRRGTISAGMMGIAQGLLSERPGEGWAPGLGRGLGYAQQNVESFQDQSRQEDEDRREDNLRYYMMDQSTNPENTFYEQQMFEVGANLGMGQMGSFMGQMYAGRAAQDAASLARTNRQVDAKTNAERSDRLIRDRQVDAEGRKSQKPEEKSDQLAALLELHLSGREPEVSAGFGLEPGQQLPDDLRAFLEERNKRYPDKAFMDEIYRRFQMGRGGGDGSGGAGDGSGRPTAAFPLRQ